MQIFPQASQSAKMFGNNSSNAYSNNQSESAKGFSQLQDFITTIMSML